MTVYVLRYSTDFGDRGNVIEPFTSKAEAIKTFNKYKRLQIEDDKTVSAGDEGRVYHINANDDPENFIDKFTIKNTRDLVKMIRIL
jgi:hypothetical protein